MATIFHDYKRTMGSNRMKVYVVVEGIDFEPHFIIGIYLSKTVAEGWGVCVKKTTCV